MTDPWKEVQNIIKNVTGTTSRQSYGGAVCDYCGKKMLDPHTSTCTKPYIILKGRLYKRDTTRYGWGDRCGDCGIKNKFGNFHHPGCDMEICPRCGQQQISCECVDDTTRIVGKEYVGKIPKGKPIKSRYAPRKKQHGSPGGRKVLELGPGDTPDSRATHSVDNTPDVETARYNLMHNPAFRGVRHTFGVDFNKNHLPFRNNMFDLVISNVVSSGGFIDWTNDPKTSVFPLKPDFYREILRVMKPGGILEMWSDKPAPEKKQASYLTSVGFKSVRFKTNRDKDHITYAKK